MSNRSFNEKLGDARKNWSVCVGFQYTEVDIHVDPSESVEMRRSKNRS